MASPPVSLAAGTLPPASPKHQALVEKAVEHTLQKFADRKLLPQEVAVTLLDLADPARPRRGSYRGDVLIYPASVIKLCYLVAAHRWMEDGRLSDTAELRRAMRDMIVESYNEATHYIIDLLSGTTSGPELPEAELVGWVEKRNVVTRYFEAMGYTGVIACKKPWGEGPYGRETQAIRAFKPSRNMLTTDDTARLVCEIAGGQSVSPRRSAEMLELMKRNPFGTAEKDPDGQSKFTGPALPPGSKLWSKAGWTSETRHDATLIELPGGRRIVLVVFTVNHANEREIIPEIARILLAGLPASD
jgi:beta-lactamase class A